MIYTITVLNEQGEPLGGANIIFGARDGYNALELLTDANGVAKIDDNVTGDLSGVPVYWTASANGYQTYTWYNDEGLTGNKTVTLQKANSVLPYVLIGGVLGGIAIAISKNKKVGGVDLKKDVLPWVLPVGVIVGGYLVYNQFFGKSPQDESRDQALEEAIANAGVPTMTAVEAEATANAIKEDLGYSWVSNNTDDAMRQLGKVKNTADILQLIKAYGKHVITTFGIPRGTFTLEETVASQMSASDIDFINRYYEAQGIAFKF